MAQIPPLNNVNPIAPYTIQPVKKSNSNMLKYILIGVVIIIIILIVVSYMSDSNDIEYLDSKYQAKPV